MNTGKTMFVVSKNAALRGPAEPLTGPLSDVIDFHGAKAPFYVGYHQLPKTESKVNRYGLGKA